MSQTTISSVRPSHRARLTDDFVPGTFEEMYSFYYDFVVSLCISPGGIDQQDAEDVAQSILLKFHERGSLDFYDPSYVTEVNGIEHHALFRTFLSGFVLRYVKHHRNMQGKRLRREPVSLDSQISQPGDEDSGKRESDGRFKLTYEPGYEEADANFAIKRIRDHLSTLSPINSQDRCEMVPFFDQIQIHAELYGRPNVTELAAHFGVSTVSIQSWLKRLRREVSKVA